MNVKSLFMRVKGWKVVPSGGKSEKRNCTGFGHTTPGSHNCIRENQVEFSVNRSFC